MNPTMTISPGKMMKVDTTDVYFDDYDNAAEVFLLEGLQRPNPTSIRTCSGSPQSLCMTRLRQRKQTTGTSRCNHRTSWACQSTSLLSCSATGKAINGEHQLGLHTRCTCQPGTPLECSVPLQASWSTTTKTRTILASDQAAGNWATRVLCVSNRAAATKARTISASDQAAGNLTICTMCSTVFMSSVSV